MNTGVITGRRSLIDRPARAGAGAGEGRSLKRSVEYRTFAAMPARR